MAKKKRLVKKVFVSKTGVEVTESYCRKCRETKSPSEFFSAVDFYLDASGLMSICKSCCYDIYDASLLRERTINKSILDICRILNIRYDESVVESVMSQVRNAESKGKNHRPIVSTYISRLKVMVARGDKIESAENYRLTFLEPSSTMTTPEDKALESHDTFWGETLSTTDVDFLETEYRKFREGYTSENYTEITLLKRVCYKLLEIKKKDGKAVGKLEKELLLLFKDLAMSPAHINAASGGQMKDTFGAWIEDIEKYTPAEWLEQDDKSMFRDIDNVEIYFQNYIVRPIKNFMIGNPDYTLIDEDIDNSEAEVNDDEELSIE